VLSGDLNARKPTRERYASSLVRYRLPIPHPPSTTSMELSGYRSIEPLYDGIRTRVYRGIRLADHRSIVLKILKNPYPTATELLQFRHQYAIASQFDSPRVVRPLSLDPYGNGYVLVMEDWEGAIVLDRYLENHSIDLNTFFKIALSIARTAIDLYHHCIVHKDIRPHNLLVHPHSYETKLFDFKLASVLTGGETEEAIDPRLLDSCLAYMSPEQTGRTNRYLDYRTDFYSLGIVFYQLLTGRLPFHSTDPLELIHAHIARLPVPPCEIEPSIPKPLSDIVLKLTAKAPEERYQSAEGLEADLETARQQWETTGSIEPFPLATHDRYDRLVVPKTLYGREGDIETLLAAFERVRRGAVETIVVTGAAGIGKTALLNAVCEPITRQRGYFVGGKFDQFQNNVPFSAFVRAFSDLVTQLLAEPPNIVAAWKIRLLDALGDGIGAIVEAVPDLARLVGDIPKTPELEAAAARNCFNRLFRQFVRLLATPEHPLVLFLDDLQWADPASLDLLGAIVGGNDGGYLLVLGAYRDDEVSTTHLLICTLDTLRQNGTEIENLTLSGLNRRAQQRLIADTLHCPLDRAAQLNECVGKKTGGNPFFVAQYLQALYDDGSISFDRASGSWQCDLTLVRSRSVTADVLDLLAVKLQKLPEPTQAVLQRAACLGNSFDLATLASACDRSKAETSYLLKPALSVRLLLPTSEVYCFSQSAEIDEVSSASPAECSPAYRFLHNRVQQAAYRSIPLDRRVATHLEIGRLLFDRTPDRDRENQLCRIANVLNRVATELDDPAERQRLAELNLLVGHRARTTFAYANADDYLTRGIALLEANCWTVQYDLALALYEAAVETAYLTSDFERVARLAGEVRRQVRHALERVKADTVEIQALATQNQQVEATRLALTALKSFGIDLPEDPTQDDLDTALADIVDRLGDRAPHTLNDLPPMRDPNGLAAMHLLACTTASAYQAFPKLYPLIVCTQVRLTLEGGLSPMSAFGFVGYGLLQCARLGCVETGFQFGRLALSQVSRSKSQPFKTEVLVVFNTYIRPWKEPLQNTLFPLLESYAVGIEMGNLEWAAYGLYIYGYTALFAGCELTELAGEMAEHRDRLRQIQQQTALTWSELYRQAVLNLSGRAQQPDRLAGEVFNVVEQLPRLERAGDRFAIGQVRLVEAMLACWFDDPSRAVACCDLAEPDLAGTPGAIFVAVFRLYDSLARLWQFPEADAAGRETILARVAANLQMLQRWADDAPVNYSHYVEWVEAERFWVLDDRLGALEGFDRAVALARENDFANDEAILCERTARFYEAWGKSNVARTYAMEAYYGYVRWGAWAKAIDLGSRYPQWFDASGEIGRSRRLDSGRWNCGTGRAALDCDTVLKIAQMLSSEIHRDRLLARSMEVMMENVGADGGALVWRDDGELTVVARCDSTPYCFHERQPCNLHPMPLEDCLALPRSIVRYVDRTGRSISSDDVRREIRFATDPAFARRLPKSLLCLPIFNRGQAVGVLYVEHQEIAGAFSSERVEMLNLLCAQVAISVENARLYDTLAGANRELQQVNDKLAAYSSSLEDTIERRTADLKAVQQQLVAQEKLASLGTLTAGVAHELRNPLNFVKNYAEGSIELMQDLQEVLDRYLDRFVREDERTVRELLADLQDNAAAIDRHSQRAENIIRNMLQHARSQTGERCEADLNRLLDEAVQLAYHSRRAIEPDFDIVLETDYDERIGSIEVVPSDLNRAWINLVDNACYVAMAKRRQLEDTFVPRVRVTTRLLDDRVEIRIRDNGFGLTPEVKARVFDPFFTTKPPGEGTGLGLSMTYDIVVRQHGGTLDVESETGIYAEFIMTIPTP